MAGFHPPKHNYIVFRYNAFLCGKKKGCCYRPLDLATRKKGIILHFNDIVHAGKKINDAVCE